MSWRKYWCIQLMHILAYKARLPSDCKVEIQQKIYILYLLKNYNYHTTTLMNVPKWKILSVYVTNVIKRF